MIAISGIGNQKSIDMIKIIGFSNVGAHGYVLISLIIKYRIE